MEKEEIKEALGYFRQFIRNSYGQPGNGCKIREIAQFFLERVMGYTSQEEVWHESTTQDSGIERVEFNERIKFFLQPLRFGQEISRDIIAQTAPFALSERAGLFGILNGQYFKLYELDISQGNIQAENVLELDLLHGQPEELANFLWPIAKRDCGRKIIINTKRIKPCLSR